MGFNLTGEPGDGFVDLWWTTMTATWDGWAKLDTLIRSAGTNLSAPITDVRRGIPFSVTGRMIRYWYDGMGSSPFSPDTFTSTQDGLRLTIGVFLPMAGAGTPASDTALDGLTEEADAAIQAVLFGDAFLGTFGSGNSAIGIQIEDTSASVESIGNAAVRVLMIPVVYGIPDHATIAP